MSEINVLQEALDEMERHADRAVTRQAKTLAMEEGGQLAHAWLRWKPYALKEQILGQTEVDWIELYLAGWDPWTEERPHHLIIRETLDYLANTNIRRTNFGLRQHLAKLATPAVQ